MSLVPPGEGTLKQPHPPHLGCPEGCSLGSSPENIGFGDPPPDWPP